MVINMRKYIVISLIGALILSIILGFYLYKLKSINEKIAFETEYKQLEVENIMDTGTSKETSSNEDKTTPNTVLIQTKYYIDCGHLVQNKGKIKEDSINKNESEFKIDYIGWKIQKFTPTEVVIYKEYNDFCNEHYKLKDVDGKIVVYQLDKYGKEKEIERKTDIQTKYLSETDIENLKDGINVCGKSELNAMIEDYE